MTTKQVCARLTPEEYEALSEASGETEADKIRSLLRSRSIANAISEPIVSELSSIRKQMESIENKVDYQRDELRALRTRLDNEPVPMPTEPEKVLLNIKKIMPDLMETLADIQDHLRGNSK